jgi:UDP-galactopyranose mutase
VRIPTQHARNSEDVVLSGVGRDLCDKFFRGYTRKQWDLDLSELSPGVAARVPARTNSDDRYFTDDFQFMPADGYSEMFQKMLSHPNITVRLGVCFQDLRQELTFRHLIFTGPIDQTLNTASGGCPIGLWNSGMSTCRVCRNSSASEP